MFNCGSFAINTSMVHMLTISYHLAGVIQMTTKFPSVSSRDHARVLLSYRRHGVASRGSVV